MKVPQEHIIRSFDEISAIEREIGLFKSRNKMITVRIQHLTSRDNLALQNQLQTYYLSSSCRNGRTGGAAAFVIFILLLWTGLLPLNQLGLLVSLSVFFLLALLAMMVSGIWSTYQYRHEVRQLAARYRDMAGFREWTDIRTTLTAA